MENKDLKISQLVVASQLDGMELIPFAKDNGNGAFLLSLLRTFIRDGLATQTSVDGKQNRLIAGHGIEISADNIISSTLDVSLFHVVDALPTADIENKIYLVKDSDGKEGENEYIEYLYVNGEWEQIGKYTAMVDLAPYQKKTDADATYAKKDDIPDVSDFVTRSAVETIAQELADARQAIESMQTKLDQIPTMPLADDKCYALQNGEWVVVADVTETLLVANDDMDESIEVASE